MIVLIDEDGKRLPLRWTDQDADAQAGIGIVMIVMGARRLDGPTFASMAECGARIECSWPGEHARVARALHWHLLDLPADRLVLKNRNKRKE